MSRHDILSRFGYFGNELKVWEWYVAPQEIVVSVLNIPTTPKESSMMAR